MNSKAQSAVSAWMIFFAVLVITGLVVAGFVFWDDILEKFKDFRSSDKEERPSTTFLLEARDTSGLTIGGARFALSRDGVYVKQGVFQDGTLEAYSGVLNTSIYTLAVSSGQYYDDEVACQVHILEANNTCTVTLERIANVEFSVVRVAPASYKGIVGLSEGVLRSPIVCVEWKNVLGVDSSLEQINVPNSLKPFFDSCSSLGDGSVTGSFVFDLTAREPLENAEFTVALIDLCDGSYRNGCFNERRETIHIQ